MKILSISELLCLTRFELIEMSRALSRQLTGLAEGSAERHATLATLANIRAALVYLARQRKRLREPSLP
jgi:hypothetical protein